MRKDGRIGIIIRDASGMLMSSEISMEKVKNERDRRVTFLVWNPFPSACGHVITSTFNVIVESPCPSL